MTVMNTNHEPARFWDDGSGLNELEPPTHWQMRQSWAIAMDNLQKMLADQENTAWSAHEEGHVTSGVARRTALMTPSGLKRMIPMLSNSAQTVLKGRDEAREIVHFHDDRLLVLVGPCSIHDPATTIEYAKLLKNMSTQLSGDLCIVMRTYFEKPRTTIGWKGLISDPDLDGSSNMNKGLHVARQLCAEITSLGLPIAGELLDPLTPTYFTDFLSVGAIGARTTESQPHRALSSALPFPVGFKNGTDGNVDVAVNGLSSAASSHAFPSLTDAGAIAIVESTGNGDCFVILRGGSHGPNYSQDHVTATHDVMLKSGHTDVGIMVDCSHGNSNKDYRNQTSVAEAVASQVEGGQNKVIGVMIESNLCEGKQSMETGPSGARNLSKGVSVTDGCIGWDATVKALEMLAAAVRVRRKFTENSVDIETA